MCSADANKDALTYQTAVTVRQSVCASDIENTLEWGFQIRPVLKFEMLVLFVLLYKLTVTFWKKKHDIIMRLNVLDESLRAIMNLAIFHILTMLNVCGLIIEGLARTQTQQKELFLDNRVTFNQESVLVMMTVMRNSFAVAYVTFPMEKVCSTLRASRSPRPSAKYIFVSQSSSAFFRKAEKAASEDSNCLTVELSD
ncbi:hypothetical protein X801_06112 [Opisthorchis viverrini]|uniref:Uncharacterized protein n=2 Tax=Opisthorchis viverrini TaxID=6198 RepID=A0A074ZL18_OPIVI|nr:hypothetical protein T265_08187 [Opisthorchis viverrini]KER24055.1 hypothetical protein T265_08187 [Opisthorchis viverrini]OON18041.1 hypothetical protein X801_06112 [Opisthorchis viverrini]